MNDFKLAIDLLSKERRHLAAAAEAQEAKADYAQAQIDYDLTHEHSSKKDVPNFKKDRDDALKERDRLRADVGVLDSAMNLLLEQQHD